MKQKKKLVNPVFYIQRNILQEEREIPDTMRWRIKGICHEQIYPKRMAQRSCLTRKEEINRV